MLSKGRISSKHLSFNITVHGLAHAQSVAQIGASWHNVSMRLLRKRQARNDELLKSTFRGIGNDLVAKGVSRRKFK